MKEDHCYAHVQGKLHHNNEVTHCLLCQMLLESQKKFLNAIHLGIISLQHSMNKQMICKFM